MLRWTSFVLFLIAATFAVAAPDPAKWQSAVDKGVKYLREHQEPTGGWTTRRSPGITGVILTGLLRTGKVTPADPISEKALKYLETLVNEKDHHIAGQGARVQMPNYVTSVNLMALVEANQDGKYKKAIMDAAEYLKKLQYDEGEGKNLNDDAYGGNGYDGRSRPDLSNTQYFLDALQAAGVPSDDPAVKRALIFVSRCQHLKGEHNDRPWAGKINDGSFTYTNGSGDDGKEKGKGDAASGIRPGYGSMTYAGIKSMIYCGVSKDDPRMVKAFEWIKKNYRLDSHPGMAGDKSQSGLYYYYHTLAKALTAAGVDTIETPDGKKHDWRAELTDELIKRQRPDGSWANDGDRFMEGDPNMVTGFALLSLSYCKPK